MTYRAHRAVMRRWAPGLKNKQLRAHFERKSKPGLKYNRRYGGTYTSATFLAMMGTISAGAEELKAGERISVFSYGSGSCSEFYPIRIGEGAREIVAKVDLDAGLDARASVTVPEYEAIEEARASYVDNANFETDKSGPEGAWGKLYAEAYEGKGLCVLDGVDNWERSYRSS